MSGVVEGSPPPSGRTAATAQAVQAFCAAETGAQNLGAGAIDSPRASEKNGAPAEGNALRGAVEKITIVAAKRIEVKG